MWPAAVEQFVVQAPQMSSKFALAESMTNGIPLSVGFCTYTTLFVAAL
jgi:hypothetical protein